VSNLGLVDFEQGIHSEECDPCIADPDEMVSMQFMDLLVRCNYGY